MNFTDYQTKSRGTAKYPAIGHAVIYPTLGLVNEAGEVAGKIKKVFRDKDGDRSAPKPAKPSKPSWAMCSGIWRKHATELDISLDEVAESNIN
jgi:hypothetical protein